MLINQSYLRKSFDIKQQIPVSVQLSLRGESTRIYFAAPAEFCSRMARIFTRRPPFERRQGPAETSDSEPFAEHTIIVRRPDMQSRGFPVSGSDQRLATFRASGAICRGPAGCRDRSPPPRQSRPALPASTTHRDSIYKRRYGRARWSMHPVPGPGGLGLRGLSRWDLSRQGLGRQGLSRRNRGRRNRGRENRGRGNRGREEAG